MNYLTFASVVITTFACFAYGQSPCKTPNGVSGTCVSLHECKPLLDTVKKNNRSATEDTFLKKSHCGFQGKTPTVCCPLKNDGAEPIVCLTPDGESGKCVDIHQCQHIAKMLNPPVAQEMETFVKKSRCSGPTNYSVCCGPAPVSKRNAHSCATMVSAYPPDPATECCGVDSTVYIKIIDTSTVFIDQYPWVVVIDHEIKGVKKHVCDGVLISGRYVLTTAHCVVGEAVKHATPHSVRLGEYDLAVDGPDCVSVKYAGEECTEGTVNIPIESITPHPDYISDSGDRENDIALIRLKALAPYTDFIRPICLPQSDITVNPPSSLLLSLAGWGANTTQTIKGHAKPLFVNEQQCQAAYAGKGFKSWDKLLCAGGGEKSCIGKSGSPLMHQNVNNLEAVGVLFYGPRECGTTNMPYVFTNIFRYKDWIMSTIKP